MTWANVGRALPQEVRAFIRGMVSSRWIRWAMLAAFSSSVLGAVALSLLLPVESARSAGRSVSSSDFLVTGCVFVFAAVLHGLDQLVDRRHGWILIRLTPLSANAALVLKLAPTVLLAIGAAVFVVAPTAVLDLRLHPERFAKTAILGAVCLAWILPLSLSSTSLTLRFLGRDGARSVLGGAAVIAFLSTLFIPPLRMGEVQWVLISALAILTVLSLPTLTRTAARSFYSIVGGTFSLRESTAPTWGVAQPWRLVTNTPGPWVAAALTLGLVGGHFVTGPTRGAIGLAVCFSVCMVLTGSGWEQENTRPERLALARYPGRWRMAVLTGIGGPAIVTVTLLSAVLISHRPGWMLLSGTAAAVGTVSVFPKERLLRSALQAIGMLICVGVGYGYSSGWRLGVGG